MFKNFNNYKRESSVRHQSEKLLDRNLVHAHKALVNEKVKTMTKEMEAAKKKAHIEEHNKQKKIKEQLNEKYASVTPDDMLKKVLIRVKTHFSKCLNLITKLFKESILNISKDLLHAALLILCNNFPKIVESIDYENFREIFLKVFENKDFVFGTDFALLEDYFSLSGLVPVE